MKKVKPWVESLRLSATIPAGILVHISFVLTHEKTDWLLAFEAFLLATFAMLHNDYVDRVNDLKKGRMLAFKYPIAFRVILLLGWIVIWLIALFPLIAYKKLLIPVIIISMVYSYTRKIPYLPNVLVAFASASPLIFANNVTISLISSAPNSLMFMAILSCIFGREIIKDIEDAEVDVGWKYTAVSRGWATKTEEQMFAQKLIGGGIGLCFYATILRIAEGSAMGILVYAAGLCICIYSSYMLLIKETPDVGKKMFDRGMLCILVALLIA